MHVKVRGTTNDRYFENNSINYEVNGDTLVFYELKNFPLNCQYELSKSQIILRTAAGTAVFERYNPIEFTPEEPNYSVWSVFANADSYKQIAYEDGEFGPKRIYEAHHSESRNSTTASVLFRIVLEYNPAYRDWVLESQEAISVDVNWDLIGTWHIDSWQPEDPCYIHVKSFDGKTMIVEGYLVRYDKDTPEKVDISGTYEMEEASRNYSYTSGLNFEQRSKPVGPWQVSFIIEAYGGFHVNASFYYSAKLLYKESYQNISFTHSKIYNTEKVPLFDKSAAEIEKSFFELFSKAMQWDENSVPKSLFAFPILPNDVTIYSDIKIHYNYTDSKYTIYLDNMPPVFKKGNIQDADSNIYDTLFITSDTMQTAQIDKMNIVGLNCLTVYNAETGEFDSSDILDGQLGITYLVFSSINEMPVHETTSTVIDIYYHNTEKDTPWFLAYRYEKQPNEIEQKMMSITMLADNEYLSLDYSLPEGELLQFHVNDKEIYRKQYRNLIQSDE